MTKLHTLMETSVGIGGSQRLSTGLSTRVWNLPALIGRVNQFAAKTPVLLGRRFAHKLAARAAPALIVGVIGPRDFRPLLDAVDVEDLEAFAIAVPRGVFRLDLLQANHALGLPSDQLLAQTVPQIEVTL